MHPFARQRRSHPRGPCTFPWSGVIGHTSRSEADVSVTTRRSRRRRAVVLGVLVGLPTLLLTAPPLGLAEALNLVAADDDDRKSSRVYVTNVDDDIVSAIDTESNRVVTTIP